MLSPASAPAVEYAAVAPLGPIFHTHSSNIQRLPDSSGFRLTALLTAHFSEFKQLTLKKDLLRKYRFALCLWLCHKSGASLIEWCVQVVAPWAPRITQKHVQHLIPISLMA